MPPFHLAHLSDPHLPSPELALREIRLKRIVSGLAWRRKRHHHRPEVLREIVADIAQAAPDHTVVTGDLTNFATTGEFAAAAEWLSGLGRSDDITVSPGNHDTLVGSADPARFAPWRPWLGDEGESFPFVRRRGPVAILNLSSAVPTPVHLAQGRLGQAQIARLATGLKAAGEAGLCRVVLIHHPVVGGVVSARKALTDMAELGEVLGQCGAELVLHGHAHRTTVSSVSGPVGLIPALGVPSASMAPGQGEAARWHGFEISPSKTGFDIDVAVRGVRPDSGVVDLGRYRLAT